MKKQKNIKKKKPKTVKNLTLEMALAFVREAEGELWPNFGTFREMTRTPLKAKAFVPQKECRFQIIATDEAKTPSEELLEYIDKKYGKQNPVAKEKKIE